LKSLPYGRAIIILDWRTSKKAGSSFLNAV